MTAPLLWFAAAVAVAADEEPGWHGVLARCRMRAEASDVDLFLGIGLPRRPARADWRRS